MRAKTLERMRHLFALVLAAAQTVFLTMKHWVSKLSPGCASFDQFEDFEDRGKQFIEIARSLR